MTSPPLACPACEEGVRVVPGVPPPEDWRPLVEHPLLKPGPWVPDGANDSVVFCRYCGALWRRTFDQHESRHSVAQVPIALRPLMSRDTTAAEAVSYPMAPTLDPSARQMAAGFVLRFFETAIYDFTEAALALLRALEAPGLELAPAQVLMAGLASVVNRGARTFPDPPPPPAPPASASKEELTKHLLALDRSIRQWTEARKNARPPRGEVRQKDALVRITSLKPALAARSRPKGDLAPVEAARARQAIRIALEQIYLAPLEEVRRRKLMFLSDEDWDALEAEISRRPSVRRVVAVVGRAVAQGDSELPVVLWEAAVELRELASQVSDQVPLRLHACAPGGPVLQSPDVRTLLKAADLVVGRPLGGGAVEELKVLLREELDRDRITREVANEVRSRLKG